jgi:hypothetical protein
MNERNIVAAILAAGLLRGQAQGAPLPATAEHAIAIYQAMLAELAKGNLPPGGTPQPGL